MRYDNNILKQDIGYKTSPKKHKKLKRRYITRSLEFNIKRAIKYFAAGDFRSSGDSLANVESEMIDMGLIRYDE